jgi:hypothetical protein
MKLERKENTTNNFLRTQSMKYVVATIMVLTLALFLMQGLAQAQAPQSKVLQVLYVIPKGQTAKPDANQAIAAIMAIIQRHYFQQLGVTFALKNPLVTTVNSPQDAAGAIDWNNHVNLIKTTLANDYLVNQNVVFAILEGTTGDAGGSWNTVKMTGGFWNDAYQTYKTNPSALVNKLHGWSHELGHAFGLLHTSDAKTCFANQKVDLGNLPSLIMQKSNDLGSVYNYPFLPQEKKLLLDPTYYPTCRPFLSDSSAGSKPRPHASEHLKHPLPLAARSITFSNQAGYVAKMVVVYFVMQNAGGAQIPIAKALETPVIPVGQSKTLEIPRDIAKGMPISVVIEGIGTTKGKVLETTVAEGFNGNLCFKSWGTIFDAKGGPCQ